MGEPGNPDSLLRLSIATPPSSPPFPPLQYGVAPVLWAAQHGHAPIVALLLATPGVSTGRHREWFPVVPLEIPALRVCLSTTTAVGASFRVDAPSETAYARTRMTRLIVPSLVHADQPLELELAAVGLVAGAGAAVSVASWISAHALLTVEIAGQSRSAPVSARPSGVGWIARALIRPAAWADAASVTVVSLKLAGRPFPCNCLPAKIVVRQLPEAASST